MKTKYKVEVSLKGYIIGELTKFKENERHLSELKKNIVDETSSSDNLGIAKTNKVSSIVESKINKIESDKDIEILEKKVKAIKRAYERLKSHEYEIADSIFNQGHTQIYCKMHPPYVEKDAYYNVKNKMIYYTAIEFELMGEKKWYVAN